MRTARAILVLYNMIHSQKHLGALVQASSLYHKGRKDADNDRK
jgi:hypothetical protein